MKDITTKKILYLLLVIPVFLLYTGCSSSWLPSDEKAVTLVKNHYLFFYGGKEVEAEVIERGKFLKECNCYPVKFNIFFSNQRKNSKIFYFHRDTYGKVTVRKFIRSG
jgi:hypothetical protein